jgi:hypothetical protein
VYREKRRSYIGGSDLANVTGVDWGCVLRGLLEKRGVEPDAYFFGNAATERGIRLEPIAAEVYAERTGREIRKAPWRSHPSVPYFGCSADYEVINHPNGPAPLSIKVPSREVFFRLRRQDEASISPAYLYQAMWEMYIWNRDWASFAFLCADPWDMKVFDFKRNQVMIDALVEAAHDFWRLKERGPLPAPLLPSDKRCGSCAYRVHCHSAHLQELLDAEDAGKDVPYMPSIIPLVEDLRERQALATETEALVEEAKDRLRAVLADADAAEAPGVRVFNRLQPGRQTFQAKAFFKDHPALIAEGEKYWNNGMPFRSLRIFEVPKRIGEK